jgi:hypothetical protein
MGDAADDARDTEEMWHDMKIAHKAGTCEGNPECPYCDPDFKKIILIGIAGQDRACLSRIKGQLKSTAVCTRS